jgi:hypothetical protein
MAEVASILLWLTNGFHLSYTPQWLPVDYTDLPQGHRLKTAEGGSHVDGISADVGFHRKENS